MSAFLIGDKITLGHSRHQPLTTEPFHFAFPAGKLVALVGRNGSGKTSLLRAILKERSLISGELKIADEKGLIDIRAIRRPELPKLLSYVPQEQPYPGFMTLSHFVDMGHLPLRGVFGSATEAQHSQTQEMIAALELAPLAEKRMDSVSSGERQRAFLGRALIQQAKVLVLDEPTNHLDPGGVAEFWEILTRLKSQRGMEIVVVSHDLEFLKTKAQWICAMKNGNLLFEGSTDDYFKDGWLAKTFTSRSPSR